MSAPATDAGAARVCVVTGSRAEFGLLRPVMHAVRAHPSLALRVIACGAHLLGRSPTLSEVKAEFEIDAVVPMQRDGVYTRLADAAGVGRGVEGIGSALGEIIPDWVVVLGDRVEALAGAVASSVGGIPLAHVHAGDRAEGAADEAMRHAISKLAHLQLAATPASAARLVRMGEPEERVVVVGSPAIDGLERVAPMGDDELRAVASGDAWGAVLLHPSGLAAAEEASWAVATAEGIARCATAPPVVLAPNHDPGRDVIAACWGRMERERGWRVVDHLERGRFLALLRRLSDRREPLVGNSSAGLIEAAALGVPVVNVGPRQAGRERAGTVAEASSPEAGVVAAAIGAAIAAGPAGRHPYGDGRAGVRIAAALAARSPLDPGRLRKRNAY